MLNLSTLQLPGLTWWARNEKPTRDVLLERKLKEEEEQEQNLQICKESGRHDHGHKK